MPRLTLAAPRLLALALALCLAGDASAHAPHDVVNELQVSPDFASDGTVFGYFVFVDQRTFGRSTDGGRTWAMRALPMAQHAVAAFAFSPDFANDGLAFCASGVGLYRTQDRGLTWQRLDGGLGLPICSDIAVSPAFASDQTVILATRSGAFRSTDGGDTWVAADMGLTESNLTFVEFAPSTGGTPVAYMGGKVVHRSASLGANWLALDNLGALIEEVAVSPSFASDNTLLAATITQGVYASTNAGLTFSANGDGLPAGQVTDITYTNSGQLFVSHSDGVYTAPGVGQAWSVLPDGLEELDESGAPHFRSLAPSPDYATDDTLLMASFEGLYRSENGGDDWEQINTYAQTLVNRLVVSPDFAHDRQVFAATPGGGVVRWSVPLDGTITPGLRVAGPAASGVAPGGPAPTPGGLTGGGAGGGAPEFGGALAVASDGLGSLWNNGLGASPDLATDDTLYYCYVGLHRSVDRGQSWTAMALPFGVAVVRDLALSPAFASDDTLFAGTNGVGFYRSTDRGDSWVAAQGGLPADFKTRRIAVSPGFAADQTLFAASWNHGVWRSTDAGDSWTSTNTGLTTINHQTLAISPDFVRDQTLLVAAKSGHLRRSTDGGQSWQLADAGLPTDDDGLLVQSIAFSPDFARDGRVACALGDGGVWLSDDGADSWQLLTTFSDGMALDVAFSPDVARDGLLLAAAPPLLRALRVDGGAVLGPASPVLLRGEDEAFQERASPGWFELAELDAFGKDITRSGDAGAWRELAFSGIAASLHARRGPDAPIVLLQLDGQPVGSVDLYAPQAGATEEVFRIELPEAGFHRLRIEHSGTSHPSATGQQLVTDGFSVRR